MVVVKTDILDWYAPMKFMKVSSQMQARDKHAEATRIFREVIGVEGVLWRQLVSAIEQKYLCVLLPLETNKITKTVPEIFEDLSSTYGDVTLQAMRELTDIVK